eukprot:COSAG02_NODE_1451_length_12556_cov_3.624258_8_plen_63_part_00
MDGNSYYCNAFSQFCIWRWDYATTLLRSILTHPCNKFRAGVFFFSIVEQSVLENSTILSNPH